MLLASIFLALAGFAVPAQAYTLTSREHRFSIELPGEPDYHGPRTIFLGDNEYTGLGWDYEHYSVHLFKLTPKMGGARFLGASSTRRGGARSSRATSRSGRAALPGATR